MTPRDATLVKSLLSKRTKPTGVLLFILVSNDLILKRVNVPEQSYVPVNPCKWALRSAGYLTSVMACDSISTDRARVAKSVRITIFI